MWMGNGVRTEWLWLVVVGVLVAARPAGAQEDEPAAPGAFVSKSNQPNDIGSGYGSWGTRGGATLGQGHGLRGGLTAGGASIGSNYLWLGYGNIGVEGYYIVGLSPNMDLAAGARIPFWPFGASPGVNLRVRFIDGDAFQLAFDGGAHVGFYFAPNFTFVFSLEPGIMASFFVKDSIEVFFGLVMPVGAGLSTAAGASFGVFNIGWDLRGGIAYTFKTINLGIYGQLDLVPNIWLLGPAVWGNFGAGLHVGVQWRFM